MTVLVPGGTLALNRRRVTALSWPTGGGDAIIHCATVTAPSFITNFTIAIYLGGTSAASFGLGNSVSAEFTNGYIGSYTINSVAYNTATPILTNCGGSLPLDSVNCRLRATHFLGGPLPPEGTDPELVSLSISGGASASFSSIVLHSACEAPSNQHNRYHTAQYSA